MLTTAIQASSKTTRHISLYLKS